VAGDAPRDGPRHARAVEPHDHRVAHGVRVLAANLQPRADGVSIVAVGLIGKKQVRYEPGATFVIFGTAD
jgi:hypothetical protein